MPLSGNMSWLIAITAFCASMTSIASSHREAPHISKYPKVDASDFYLFNSYEPGREDYVIMLANYNPMQAHYGTANFFSLDSAALYEIHIDNNGDAMEDITFQFRFTHESLDTDIAVFEIGSGQDQKSVPSIARQVVQGNLDGSSERNYQESYSVTRVSGDRRTGQARILTDATTDSPVFSKPYDYVGNANFGSAESYTRYADSFVHTAVIPDCNREGRVFVGQRLESFKSALGEVFDLVGVIPIEADGTPGSGDGDGFPGGVRQDVERNPLARNNVTTIALEIHKSCLTGSGNGVIGAWTTASLRQATILNPKATLAKPEINGGAWTQVSRLGNILVNELMIGFSDKDRFNASEPKDDLQFINYITHPVLPAIVSSLLKEPINSTLNVNIHNLAPSNIPRHDLISSFLTGLVDVNQLSTATSADMLRLNTSINATARENQQALGFIAGDFAGFPNGRRPGDDAVDIALRIIMGALCYDIPIGDNAVLNNLGICDPEDAPIGNVALTDGVPITAMDFDNTFPFLITPYPGSPVDAPIPLPKNY